MPDPKVRQYKKEVKNFLENNPGSNIEDFNLQNQNLGTSNMSDKSQNKQAEFVYNQQQEDYKNLIKSGEKKENIVESESLGKYDRGFSEYRTDQEIKYAYDKQLDPTNTDWQSRDSFWNNPINRDRGGETTTRINHTTDLVQSSRTGVLNDKQINEFKQIAQTDGEFQDFYSPQQLNWLKNNATTLGLSEKDIQKIEKSGGGTTSIYQDTSYDANVGKWGGTTINSIDNPDYRGGSINVDDKTWTHTSPIELQSSFEKTNASVMNNPNLSNADKKAKLDAMSKDYIEKWKSGEKKVTSGRQIFEEEFQPAANQAITEARLQFQEEKDNIINNPDRIRNKFTLGGNK